MVFQKRDSASKSNEPARAWDVSVTIPDITITSSPNLGTPMDTPHVSEELMLHKYSRRFRDPALEKEYTAYLTKRNVTFQKIVLGFAIVMILIALAADYMPPLPPSAPILRVVDSMATVAVSATFIALFFKKFQIHSQKIVSISLTFYTVVVIFDAVWIGHDPQAGYAASVVLGMVLICRLKFWTSFVACAVIVIMHVIFAAVHNHSSFTAVEIIGFPFGTLATCVVCLYPSYYIDSMLRRAFLNKTIMSLEERNLAQLRVRVDALLNNIFPPVLREKLQAQHKKSREQEAVDFPQETPRDLICDEHQDVTVLMADIVGFTSLSSRVSPQQIVDILNTVFSVFDDIVDEHGMEKIRTLGDAYLCVANMTYPKQNHQDLAVTVARQMISALPKLNEQFRIDPPLALRIGLASGPVISGVTGISKWNYDIFGDTVLNTFAMEASCPPLSVAISPSVWNSLKENAHLFNPITPGRSDAFVATLDHDTCLLPALYRNPSTKPFVRFTEEDPKLETERDVARKIIANSTFYQAQKRVNSLTVRTYSNDQMSIKELAARTSESRELMERAQKELKQFSKRKKVKFLKFNDKAIEEQFLESTATSSQAFTWRLTSVSIISFVLFILSDVMSSSVPAKEIPKNIWITDGVIIAVALAFTLFARTSLFLKPIAVPINALYVITIGTLLACQQFIDPITVYHTYHPYLIIYICFQYIRMKQLVAVGAGMVVVIVSLVIFVMAPDYVGPLTNADNLTHLILYLVIVFISGFTNYLLELAFRREFLSTLILRKSMEEQENNNRQAKLLIYNILPRQIAYKLTSEQHTVVNYFPNATMSFATLLIGDLAAHPREMFTVLNEIFTLFDKLVIDQECEKIKTINTTYMVVSGLPKERSDHATCALHLMQYMFRALRNYRCPYTDPRTGAPYQIGMRVGVASGPVVAGVIGKAKYAYDCWSDITNTASRMESNGLEGHIQMTKTVYLLVHEEFPQAYRRGELQIKGKGLMETYLLPCDT